MKLFRSIIFIIELLILLIINLFSFSFSKTSSIIPLYKIILTENISHLEINDIYNFRIQIKGNGIIINNSSDINIMPMHIFTQIFKFYQGCYDDILAKIIKVENDYSEFTMVANLSNKETIHFILEEKGITIPIQQLFVLKDEEAHLYSFRFLAKEEEENIIFGKDLIELMNIDFKDNNQNFVINNDDYISKIEDE